MRLVKLWDTGDNEILIDMDRKATPLPDKKPNIILETIFKYIMFIFASKRYL